MTASVRALLLTRLRACRARLGQIDGADVVVQGDEGDRAVQGLERELATGDRARLTEEARRLIRALRRIEHGAYGRCDECGEKIASARLRAIPDAERCLSCAERAELEERHRARATSRRPDPPLDEEEA